MKFTMLRVLMALSTRFNVETEDAWPSLDQLVEDTGIEKKNLGRALKEAEAFGLLTITRGVGSSSNRYRFVLDKARSVSPDTKSDRDCSVSPDTTRENALGVPPDTTGNIPSRCLPRHPLSVSPDTLTEGTEGEVGGGLSADPLPPSPTTTAAPYDLSSTDDRRKRDGQGSPSLHPRRRRATREPISEHELAEIWEWLKLEFVWFGEDEDEGHAAFNHAVMEVDARDLLAEFKAIADRGDKTLTDYISQFVRKLKRAA
ncbi:MAG: helix-turn-helix domain-containing protein [Pseudomonadota bacterium]|nr:helix-turn-helix domain-containing protein [Pseudomonadota bacterium]